MKASEISQLTNELSSVQTKLELLQRSSAAEIERGTQSLIDFKVASENVAKLSDDLKIALTKVAQLEHEGDTKDITIAQLSNDVQESQRLLADLRKSSQAQNSEISANMSKLNQELRKEKSVSAKAIYSRTLLVSLMVCFLACLAFFGLNLWLTPRQVGDLYIDLAEFQGKVDALAV